MKRKPKDSLTVTQKARRQSLSKVFPLPYLLLFGDESPHTFLDDQDEIVMVQPEFFAGIIRAAHESEIGELRFTLVENSAPGWKQSLPKRWR